MTSSISPGIRGANIFIGEASKPSIISGKEKYRLLIGQDKSLKFAFAIFSKKFENYNDLKTEWSQPGGGKNWVPLRTEKGTVRADISSIARRTGLDKEEIRKQAANGLLEKTINQKLSYYSTSLFNIGETLRSIEVLSNNIKKEKDANQILTDQNEIKEYIKTLPGTIVDPELKVLCKQLKDNCQKMEPGKPSFEHIGRELEKFKAKLPELNLERPVLLKEKIGEETEAFGGRLFSGKAMPLHDSKGNLATRLRFVDENQDNKGRFAVKTDGYLYHVKPEANRYYIPYSEDGKVWVRLNINSLAKRFSLDQEGLAKLDSKELKKVIDRAVSEKVKEQKEFSVLFREVRQFFKELHLRQDFHPVSMDDYIATTPNSNFTTTLEKTLSRLTESMPEVSRSLIKQVTHVYEGLKKETEKGYVVTKEKWAQDLTFAFDSFAEKSLWWDPQSQL